MLHVVLSEYFNICMCRLFCVYAFHVSVILCLGTLYHFLGMSVSVCMYTVHVHISVYVTTNLIKISCFDPLSLPFEKR